MKRHPSSWMGLENGKSGFERGRKGVRSDEVRTLRREEGRRRLMDQENGGSEAKRC
jgi:hypothetical protein